MFRCKVIRSRAETLLWKQSRRLKLTPEPLHDVAVSVLWKDGRSSYELMELVMMAFGAHNFTFEIVDCPVKDVFGCGGRGRGSAAVLQCRNETHALSVDICVMSAAEQRMAAYSKSLKSESLHVQYL